ncbi:MAG: hypothetical protein GQF41_2487 [Candidatus Rifleibacterium amylolyticum]|nr:MAG: hypothetical protein GQF41_2487 [Candidatus Rifleibacterium amylolyticum]
MIRAGYNFLPGNFRIVICLLAIFLAATAVWADSAKAGASLDKVVLRLKWLHQFQFAGYYAAIEKGYYREAGLELEIVEDNPEEESVKTVISGRAHFGIGGAELLLHRSRGEPVVVLAAIYQHSPLAFLVPATSDITNVHQLAGRRVMLEKHSAELLAYLRAEGLKMEDLEILPHTYGVNELIAGKADAISAYLSDEPFNFVEHNLEYRVFTPQSSGIDFYGDVLFTSEEQVVKYPERVAAFVKATKKGWQYAMDHPQEIVDLIFNRYSQRHSRAHLLFEAEKSKALIGRDVVEIGYMNPGRWRHIAEKYNELGMLPADVSLEGFIYSPESDNDLFWRRVVQVAEIVIAFLLLLFVIRMIRSHFNLEELYRKNRVANHRLKKSRKRISMLLGSMPGMAYKYEIGNRWTLRYASRGCRKLTGYKPEDLINNFRTDYASLIVPEDLARIRPAFLNAIETGKPYNLTYRIIDAAGQQKWVWDQGSPSGNAKTGDKTRRLEGFITDITESKNLEVENQKIIADLQQALGEIKVLRGIIPICSSCKKIRDDKGLWNQVEQYLKEHTDSEFSHGICPECAAKIYPRKNL